MTHLGKFILVGLTGALPTLCGCAQYEPYDRVGTWRAEGTNQSNLASMAANPLDLVQGRGNTSPHYRQPGDAVTNLWATKPAQALLPGLKGGGASAAAAPSPAPAAAP